MKRLIKKGKLYKLIDLSKPIIVDHTNMLSDNKKGGVLLKYMVTNVLYISLFKHDYALYSISNNFEYLSFFKPLKRDWDRNAYKITQRYWGKKSRLLTELWLMVDTSFKDIFSVTTAELARIPQCKDAQLIKELNAYKEVFILSNIKTDNKRKKV